jgi:hypothetical protein
MRLSSSSQNSWGMPGLSSAASLSFSAKEATSDQILEPAQPTLGDGGEGGQHLAVQLGHLEGGLGQEHVAVGGVVGEGAERSLHKLLLPQRGGDG